MFIAVYRGHVTELVSNEAKTFSRDSVIIHGMWQLILMSL